MATDRERADEAQSEQAHTARREAPITREGHAHDASTGSTLKRAFKEFSEDKMTAWAAALTYYGLLSIFPALIVLVSLVGYFADPRSATMTITQILSGVSPGAAASVAGPIQSITSNPTAAGIAGIVALVGALSSASAYVGTFMTASNQIYEVPEGRPFWKLKPLQMLITLAMIAVLLVIVLALVVSGPLVDAIAGPLGIGATAATIYQIAKWPIIGLLAALAFTVLYYSSPNVRQRGLKFIFPGALLALVVWIVASAAFAIFVANFGSYNATYGALAGVIVLLVWLWITNIAILLGAELNAERERGREIAEGTPGAERRLQLRPRDEPERPATE